MIQAINNYCTLKIRATSEELKIGEILIPNTSTPSPRWADILSVGPGVMDGLGNFIKPDVNVNDLVYVMAHGQYSVPQDFAGIEPDISVASYLDILVKLEDMKSKTILPLGNYIEIEKLERPNLTNLELPENKKCPTNLGKVKTLGKGWIGPLGNHIPMQVEVGDIVVYSPLRTMVVDFSSLGEEHKTYLIQHGDILGIVKE